MVGGEWWRVSCQIHSPAAIGPQSGGCAVSGRLELLDKDDNALFFRDDELGGERADMEVRPKEPIRGVRTIRFTSLRDEGDKNPYDDVAIGEILVE